MYEAVGAVVVSPRRPVSPTWRLLLLLLVLPLLPLLSLLLLLLLLLLWVLVVHEVGWTGISVGCILRAPNFLLALRVGEDGLRKGGRRGGKLTAIIRGAVVVVVAIEAKVELEPVGRGVGVHPDQERRTRN